MSDDSPNTPRSNIATDSRRTFLKRGGQLLGGSALAGVSLPLVHAANGDETTRVALIGCGGRGTGAVQNAINAFSSPERQGDIRLHAMADVFESKITASYEGLKGAKPAVAERIDVPDDRKFLGFDAYKDAMDTLRPGDIAIFTTPCAFRWVDYAYAIEKDLNVFMEKPLCPDGPSARRMLALNEKAKAKNLKVGVGLMCRHCDARGELFDRIQNGEIGDIMNLRGYRMQGPIGSAFTPPNPDPDQFSDLMWQIRNFHGFLWLSGGTVSDFSIHNIDECCWMKNDWPTSVRAMGGRHYRGDAIDQNFDTYSIEYTFPDGTFLHMDQRNVPGCENKFTSLVHGTEGCGVISDSAHAPSRARLYRGQTIHRATRRGRDDAHPDLLWAFDREEPSPYDLEWEALIDAIQNNTPFNEVERGVKASVVTAMGRMAAHTGQAMTYDEMLNCEHEMSPNSDTLTMDSESPLPALPDGSYPIPEPGVKKDREY